MTKDREMGSWSSNGLESIRARFALGEPIAWGSTAQLYRHSEGWLYRLTESSGSHHFLIRGHRKGLAFPKVLQDFDEVPGEGGETYHMAIFEECTPVPYEYPRFSPLARILTEMSQIWWSDDDKDRDSLFRSCRRTLESNREYLSRVRILDTLHFAIDFAEEYGLSLDFDLSNMMLNREGDVVVTDLVHGDW